MSLSKKVIRMREEYDFSKGRKNPYIKRLKKQVTMNIDCSTIEYFKDQSEESGIPYQVLINLYLADCVKQKKKFQPSWVKDAWNSIEKTPVNVPEMRSRSYFFAKNRAKFCGLDFQWRPLYNYNKVKLTFFTKQKHDIILFTIIMEFY